MIWMDACSTTIQKRRSHPSTQRAVFLEVAVNGNEHTLMQCIIPLGLGFKPCLHGNCCNDDKFSVSINKMAKKEKKKSTTLCVFVSGFHWCTCHMCYTEGAHQHHRTFYTVCLTDRMKQNWFVRVCICSLQDKNLSQQSTSEDAANREMFICKATCTLQLILPRMSHPQATYSTFEVSFG